MFKPLGLKSEANDSAPKISFSFSNGQQGAKQNVSYWIYH